VSEAAFDTGFAMHERSALSQRIPVRSFNADNIGAKVGQETSGQHHRLITEVEHSHAG
jgi:hypothetical protein